jgi:hypothetical protein
MTTSGTATWNPVRDKVVYGALRLCGKYGANGIPRAEDVSDAIDALDMMLKSWVDEGYLWKKKFIYVTLAANQPSYTLGPDTTDTVTTDAAGAVPYLQRPSRVFFPTRYTIATTGEVPLEQLSREKYTALPNKATTGTPVSVFYDPQIGNGNLYIWPVPTAVGDKIILTVDSFIEDVGTDEQTYDLPPEAMEMLKYNLAWRMGIEYQLSAGRIATLEKYALGMKERFDSLQRDNASTFFQPA